MMQLLCNGVQLDMYDNAGIQFTHDNPLFAFDNLKCERTTQFKLPSTPVNDRVFSLARIPAYDGTGMRQRFTAQLQASAVTKDGYLYVDNFDGKDYAAVFVTGEFLGLQAVKNAGKIVDVLPDNVKYNTTCTIYNTGVSPAYGRSQIIRQLAYATNAEIPTPSVLLHSVLTTALQQLSVAVSLPEITQYVRFIPDKIGTLASTAIDFTASTRSMSQSTYPIVYTPSVNTDVADVIGTGNDAKVRMLQSDTWYYGKIRQLQAKQTIDIAFPEDWNDNLFIGYFINGDTHLVAEFSFYGDRSFDEYGNITGESLRGRSVTIEQGSWFVIISKDDYVNQDTSGGHMQGWAPQSTYCEFTMQGKAVTSGGIVRLADNLPDVSITDLLKTLAAISGKILYYTDADGITFDTLDYSTWGVEYLDGRLLSKKEVKRTFADYAQKNNVLFESGESVPDKDKLSVAYTINNVNLESEKELQKIPFSEGRSNGVYDTQTLIYNAENEKALADASTGASTMARVPLIKNTYLQNLCTASTQFKVSARMTLFEYMQVTPKTLIQVDGTRYVWTSRSWQKNEAQFTLAKVP